MSNKAEQETTLQSKQFVRALNLGAYIGLVAVSGLILGATSTLGSVSALLFSSFMLALYYSIDSQLLNINLMSEMNIFNKLTTADTFNAMVCDIMDQKLNNVELASEIQISTVNEQDSYHQVA